MRWSLRLASETMGLASPNPQVGCVLVRDGQVIAEGRHVYDQRDHAEIAALKQAAQRGESVEGATAYVALEPCSHHGRTGPCADALIAAKIARCVVATADPNPLVAGQGIQKLRAAGIEVTVGVLQQQARDLNDAFAYSIQHRRPLVTLKAALSVDGYLAPPPSTRTATQPHWLTGAEARAEVQRLRHSSDAILTGIGTVLSDDPALTDRSGLQRRRPLLRVILDSQLRIPLNAQLLQGHPEDVLLIHDPQASPERVAALQTAGAELLPIPLDPSTGRLNLQTVLAALAERQSRSVLLECGSALNGAFLGQGLVDKAILFYSETELGSGSVPFAQGIDSPFLFQQSLRRTTQQTFGTDAMLTGYLHYPWPGALLGDESPAAESNPTS